MNEPTPQEIGDVGWQLRSRAILGRCVEVGDDDEGQPRILIHTTREELMKGRNIVFEDCVVMRADELDSAEGVANDTGRLRWIVRNFDEGDFFSMPQDFGMAREYIDELMLLNESSSPTAGQKGSKC